MHTLHLRGNLPSFIHISDGSCTTMPSICSCRKPEPYVVDRGYVDFARLYVLHQAGAFFVTRAKSNIDAHRVIRRRRIARPASFATRPSPWTASTPVRITPNFAAHPLQGPRVRQDAGLHHQQLLASGRHHLRALQKPLAGGTLLQVDQAASSDQALPEDAIGLPSRSTSSVQESIEATLHSVRVANVPIVKPSEFRAVGHQLILH